MKSLPAGTARAENASLAISESSFRFVVLLRDCHLISSSRISLAENASLAISESSFRFVVLLRDCHLVSRAGWDHVQQPGGTNYCTPGSVLENGLRKASP